MRHADPQALAARGAAVGARHVGLRPGLVDEDQPLRDRGRAGRRTRPAAASGRRDDPARWRARSFFARDPVAGEEALQRPVAEGVAAVGKRRAQLLHRDVRRLRQQRRGSAAPAPRSGPSGDPRRAARAGRRPAPAPAPASGSRSPRSPRTAPPPPDGSPRGTAARTRVRRSTESAFDMPAGLPSGRQLESEHPPHGNPQDSVSSASALEAETIVLFRADQRPSAAPTLIKSREHR